MLLVATDAWSDSAGSISGRVIEAGTQQPLTDAYILVGGTPRYATTDDDGTFVFGGIQPGTYRLRASRVGFAPSAESVDVRAGKISEIRFELTPNLGLFDPVLITASRLPGSLMQSSVTAHVVEDVDRLVGPQTVVDVLRDLPGIDLSGGGAPGLVSGASLRGASPSQTLILVDGMRVNTAGRTSTLGGVDLSQFSLDGLERVEIVKGPGSALYGGDAGGGVIQLFSRGVRDGRNTRVSITGGAGARLDEDGTYATQRYHLFHGRRQGPWEWTLDGSMGASGGHLDNTDSRAWNAAGKAIRHRPNGRTALRAEVLRRRGGAPGAEGQGQFGAFDIDDRQNDDIIRLNLRDRRPLGSRMQFEGTASAQWWRVERLNPVIQAGEVAGDFLSRHQLWMVEPRVRWTGPYLQPLTVGAEFRAERQRDAKLGTETAGVWALYAQNRLERGGHLLEVGARMDDHSLYGAQFNPRISTTVRLAPRAVLHASLGRAFVAPVFDDLFKPTELFAQAIGEVVGETGNRALKPEKVWSADAGVRWQSSRSLGEVSLYWSRYRDLIQPVTRRLRIQDGDAVFLTLGNVAEANIAGVELTQRLRILPDLQAHLSYTYQQASSSDDQTGEKRDLVGRLRQKLSGSLSVGLGESIPVELSLWTDWQERHFDEELFEEDGDDDEAIAAVGAPDADWRYFSLGASARIVLTPRVSLHADAANLTDERYQSVFGIPQPGLLISAGLKLDLE